MTLSDLASLGSFVSGLAVLISLIYLAVQVRQNRKHTAAQVSQSRVDLGLQQQNIFLSDPAVVDLMLRAARGDTDLTDNEGLRFFFLASNMFLICEDEYRQYKAGLISEERHKGYVKRMSQTFRLPGYRAMWGGQRPGFESDFQAFIDALVEQGRKQKGSQSPREDWIASVRAEVEHQADATAVLPVT